MCRHVGMLGVGLYMSVEKYIYHPCCDAHNSTHVGLMHNNHQYSSHAKLKTRNCQGLYNMISRDYAGIGVPIIFVLFLFVLFTKMHPVINICNFHRARFVSICCGGGFEG